jgi:hypothetical protein
MTPGLHSASDFLPLTFQGTKGSLIVRMVSQQNYDHANAGQAMLMQGKLTFAVLNIENLPVSA